MSHVTKDQRYAIERMLSNGYKCKEISKLIGKDKSVISREIRRNCDKRSGKYNSELAQRKYETRMKEKPKKVKFSKEVEKYVEDKLSLKWSPEQISNTLENQGLERVSHERIYQHIIKNKKEGGELYKHLRRRKKYKKRSVVEDRRGKIKNAKNIKERPEIVNKKERVGDFEVDLVMGANHKGALITMNDRKTGLVKIRQVKSKDAEVVSKAIIKALKPYKPILKTITSDNGKEFSLHDVISKELEIDFYFADPYSSWQRGANENLNGLIRQFFPKKTSFEVLTRVEVKKVENLINQRPRKRLGYETPLKIFNRLTKVAFVV